MLIQVDKSGWIGLFQKRTSAISKILFILGSNTFLACLECVRSYALPFGHSDPDPSSVTTVGFTNSKFQNDFWPIREKWACFFLDLILSSQFEKKKEKFGIENSWNQVMNSSNYLILNFENNNKNSISSWTSEPMLWKLKSSLKFNLI